MDRSFLLHELLRCKPSDGKLYLVGGAVRDFLLQKEGKDFDLVCDFDPRVIARAFADAQKGAYFLLDAERKTARVILEKHGQRVLYDFARLNKAGLNTDLEARDFTINAMAIDLEAPDHIIDPLHGAQDLHDHSLRACSDRSFEEDPVRVIRGVRYAVNLELSIQPDTLEKLKLGVPFLLKISRERSRDEFLKVIESSRPRIGLDLLHRLGILDSLGFDASGINFVTASRHMGALEQLFSTLEGIGTHEPEQGLAVSAFLLRLGRFRDPLLDHFYRQNSSMRTLRTLDLLAAYLVHLDKADFEQSLERLALSNAEKEHLIALNEHQNDLMHLDKLPDRRHIYRFFKRAPVDVCFLHLARLLTLPTSELSADAWLDALQQCELLVDAWLNHPEVVAPKAILNGNDLMVNFELAPGKQLGSILETLQEEYAAGTILTREGALHWVEHNLLQ